MITSSLVCPAPTLRIEFSATWVALGSPDLRPDHPDWVAWGAGARVDRMDLPAGQPIKGRAWGELLEVEARWRRRGH